MCELLPPASTVAESGVAVKFMVPARKEKFGTPTTIAKRSFRLTMAARTERPQIIEGVDTRAVTIMPEKLDGVIPNSRDAR
jgi:hypothetical protein